MRRQLLFIPLLISSILVICADTGKSRTAADSSSSQPVALVLEAKGVVGPAFAEYVIKGLVQARQQQAEIMILQLDTPGGLDSSMRDIIKAILASPVAVATYVSPEGSRAASAGTYILYASHVAAMAPATNLGAATPVSLTPLPKPDTPTAKEKEEEHPERPPTDTLQQKIINDAEAYIKALAKKRGRNSEWAAKAVTHAESLTADEALRLNVIDIVAVDLTDLLRQMDGRTVETVSGSRQLRTAEATPLSFAPDWRTRILMILTDPNIAYILLLLGVYGLFFEMTNPGYIFPGVMGAISIVIALFTFQVLPINYAGLALLALGMIFMVAEAVTPTFGALGSGGLIAFVIGSIILMDEPYLRISLPIIGATAATSALLLIMVIGRLLSIRRRQIRTGSEELLNSVGETLEDISPETEGRIWIHGESWKGRSSEPLRKGQAVRVVGQNGLVLYLESAEEKTNV